ncbi:MAG: type II/IV secretion system protein, partial [Candidatus Omnitrophica bacterium]|nr:type II/IV secretion system protein [Candidatus Omnitrophota bacterium]
YMLSSSLIAVIGQRLVRKLCFECKEAYEPKPEELRNIKLKADLIYKAKGCAKCNNTGYRGRVCVSEVMFVNEEIRSLVSQRAPFQQIRDVAKSFGMQTLYESALKKVEEGSTSLEDALSIALGAE